MRVAVGQRMSPPKKSLVRRLAIANAPIATAMAPPMTKASDGSQVPAISRKPTTLAGFVIPEISKPNPKRAPTTNSLSRCFMRHLQDDATRIR